MSSPEETFLKLVGPEERIIPVLHEVLLDRTGSAGTQLLAIELLANRGDVTSLPVLDAFAKTSDPSLRSFVERSMFEIYKREFPTAQAPAMKTSVAKSESKLSFVPRADVIMPGDGNFAP